MRQFCWGMLSMGSLVASLFFLKYWRISSDRLFAFFAVAFVLLAENWLVLAMVGPRFEARHLVYVIRLAAFVLILIGVADKNRALRR
jgi:membrane protein CcdC involved in cytochrome C biogenesis